MELKTSEFTGIAYKKTEKLTTFDFLENGNPSKAKSKALSDVKKKLEELVIQNGAITTHAGFFILLYADSDKKPWALMAYHPSFNYDVYTKFGDIIDYLQINAPGMQI